MQNDDMIIRKLSEVIQKKKSILLLGPRQVGKSTLIKSLKPDLTLNLAEEDIFLEMTSNPAYLKIQLETHSPKTVFIDEVQRFPRLLNTVQAIIDEDPKILFYITGSSARKLKRGRANLLPGRVYSYQLGPLVASELNYKMDQEQALRFGSLPEAYLSKTSISSKKLLRSYSGTYLKEEIQAEALVRNIDQFSRFLQGVVNVSGQFVDFTKLSQRVKVPRLAVPRFFEILEDSLIGERIYPSSELLEIADLVKHPKFYLFDTGIYNALQNNFEISHDRIGILAEHLIFNQIRHSAWAFDQPVEFSTFRTRGGLEVDLLLKMEQKYFGVEIKASDHLAPSDVEPLLKLKTYVPGSNLMVFHLGKKKLKLNGVWCLPWQQGLKELGL